MSSKRFRRVVAGLAIKRFFMKLFRTNHIDIITHCLEFFNFQLLNVVIPKRVSKFYHKLQSSSNIFYKKFG